MTATTPAGLDPDTVNAATKELSGASGFWFTRRCLMFELCRREAWPEPKADLERCEQDFAAALAEHERSCGLLPRLIRPEDAIPGIGSEDLETFDLPSDLFDYAIARVALVERIDLCLMLIANGFHREIEVALTVPPNFPSHVWGRLHAQLETGLRTTFLTLHDYGESSEAWLEQVDEQLLGYECAQVLPAGLTMPWLSRLQLPLRGGQAPVTPPEEPLTDSDPALPADSSGPAPPARSYALLEELPPLRIMRWIYGRIARGAEDVGFG